MFDVFRKCLKVTVFVCLVAIPNRVLIFQVIPLNEILTSSNMVANRPSGKALKMDACISTAHCNEAQCLLQKLGEVGMNVTDSMAEYDVFCMLNNAMQPTAPVTVDPQLQPVKVDRSFWTPFAKSSKRLGHVSKDLINMSTSDHNLAIMQTAMDTDRKSVV